MHRGLILLSHILLLISIFPAQSDATSITNFLRQLAAKSRPLAMPQLPLQISPSPSPSPAAPAPVPLNLQAVVTKPSTEPVVTKPNNMPAVPEPSPEPDVPKSIDPVVTKPSNKPVATKPNTEPVAAETCDKMPKKCHLDKVTACLGVEGLLLVLNDDDISLKANVTVLPVNITYKNIEIPRQQPNKINISDSVRGSSSIVLHARNEDCIIHMGAVVPKDDINPQFPTFDTYITPINGVYVLFASALIIGGTWTCFKSWKGRHTRVDGIPYQELEMGQSDLVSSVNVETADGWDQSWDDDWDEEKGVKSASETFGSSTGNGNISRSNSGGWRNDWDD